MSIKGKVILVGQTHSGVSASSGKTWKKQEYVLDTGGQYPTKIAFSIMNDKYVLQVGDEVELEYNLSSREFNGKWYTDVTVWKANIRRLEPQNVARAQNVYEQQPPQGYQAPQYPQTPPEDDIPF